MRTDRTVRRLLLLNFILLLAACVSVHGQASYKSVRHSPAQSNGAVKRLGVFTNMRFTKEHQYGYSVELWQEGGRLFGLLLVSDGLAGDTPTGLLEDVAFDSKTGKLSFRARLSTGSTFNKQNEQVPTRDLYRFDGALRGQTLTGVFQHSDAANETAAATKKRVTLRRSKSESASMIQATSYDDWKNQTDEILKLRGPKW
ncbi:MAG TPA: hypothetical protein VJ866_04925 [Pyrinomonadaceae bacterium]|nr:hypothetical protein [Pyrinomonadaceae bacterium]